MILPAAALMKRVIDASWGSIDNIFSKNNKMENIMDDQLLDRKRLYHVGNLSIFMIGLGFAVRANIAPNLQADIYNEIDLVNSASMLGEALGATFTGFALTLLFGSALVDLIGMKRMLLLSALGYIAGAVGLLVATTLPVGGTVETVILVSLLLTGLGWGAVEAASNPMVAALYPEEKTHRLNILHAWWPAGIVVGGLMGVAITGTGLPWELNMFVLLLPAVVLAWMVATSVFPVTERVASGVSYGEMFAELVKRPLFWVFWVCMYFTAASELAPGQWVNISLSNIVGMQGILLLVYVSALMFVMRHFAGPIVARISSIGLMFVSCLAAGTGLYLLSLANTPLLAFAAATVWGIGVCYMWPTMLAIVAERFPRGGAMAMGLMGFAGGMSIQFVLPRMGAIFDTAKAQAAGGADKLATLSPDALQDVIRYASVESFQAVAYVPLLLLPVFGLIWLVDRATGGKTQ
jgi:MFS family permease